MGGKKIENKRGDNKNKNINRQTKALNYCSSKEHVDRIIPF